RMARSVLKCPDDRKNRVVSVQATYTSGSSAVGGRVCGQRYAAERVLHEPSCGLAVVLSGGRQIEVHPDLDMTTFERLVSVLERVQVVFGLGPGTRIYTPEFSLASSGTVLLRCPGGESCVAESYALVPTGRLLPRLPLFVRRPLSKRR